MLADIKIGQQITSNSLSVGTAQTARGDNVGSLVVVPSHGKYREACYQRRKFLASSQAPIAVTAGLATVYTGLCLSNSPGSSVNVEICTLSYSFTVAFPAAASIGISTGYNAAVAVTHTTPIAPKNAYINGATPLALVDAACTLPTAPTVSKIIGSGLTGALATAMIVPDGTIDIDGGIILPPGAYAMIYCSTASGALGFMGSISWIENPL